MCHPIGFLYISVEKGVSYLIAFGNSNYVDFYDYHKCKNMHAQERKNDPRVFGWKESFITLPFKARKEK